MFFPAISTPIPGGKGEAKTAVSQLSGALKSYYTEYGKWPNFTEDGRFLDASRNAELLRVLTTTHDEANNSRRITFFEAKIALPGSASGNRLASGLDPITGTFLDPWGNPYRIILDSDYDGIIASPYSQDPSPKIHSSVIVWSVGKDGKQGTQATDQISQGSDDIRSWP